MNPDALAKFSDSHLVVVEGRPAWATFGFAIAVFGGTVAAALLLLRKPTAVLGFVLSMLGTVALMGYTLSVFLSLGSTTISDILMMTVMPIIAAGFFIWYARLALGKGWLG
ncbi:MAG: hypothetical protein ACI861_002469 [Paracoccaceae bacterium]|jgi:hypothetical protein